MRRGYGSIGAIPRCWVNRQLTAGALGLAFNSSHEAHMGRNDIKLDQIRARLGDLDKPRVYDPYSNDSAPQNQFQDEYEEAGGGSTFNAGFIASIVALFLVVSGGTFYFTSGGSGGGFDVASLLNWRMASEPAFVSKVDAVCKPMWASPGFNHDALACYMVESPARFCDVRERDYFINLITRFRVDLKAEQSIELAEVVAGLPDTFKQLDKAIADSDAGRPVQTIKSKHPRKPFKYLTNMKFEQFIGEMQKVGQNPSLMGHIGANAELPQMLRKLILQGYFQLFDFGMFRDAIVEDALKDPLPDMTKVKPPCGVTKS
jgi:hypothetical protein